MRKPNLVVPLANSYNVRGIQGNTNSTNSIDQRKINCIYEVANNPVTGSKTLYLAKRPGVAKGNALDVGTSTQQPYLIQHAPNVSLNTVTGIGVFNTDGGNLKVSTTSANTTILGSTSLVPLFVDKTLISGVETIVLQIGSTGFNATQRVYFATDFTSWTEITDGDFTGLTHTGKMEHMDGFAFIMGQSNKIVNSDLNSLANWTAANFITKQIQQDYPVGLAKFKNQILAFGQQSVEAFYNAGNASGSPLSGIKQLQNKIGMVATFAAAGGTHYYCVIADIMYFVGFSSGGASTNGASKSLFAYDGSNYARVSTSFVDAILGEGAIYSVNSFGVNGRNAVAINLTANSAASQRWLMYFPEWKEWFEWTSTIFFPTNNQVYGCGLKANSLGNQIYNSSAADNWQDDGTSYQFSTQFKLPTDGPNRKRMEEFGVIGDTARSANTLTVEVSDDDYQNWTTKATLDLTSVRKSTVRGGTYIDRAIRLSNTNALETRLQSFTALVK